MYLEQFLVFSTFFIYHTTGSALHGECFTSEDCGTIDTYCKNNTCACKENFAVWYDSCIQLPTPGIRCTKKHDCHASLGVRSICTKRMECACKPFHHIHMGQCVKNRDLDDACDHDHQCYCGAGCENRIACIEKQCSCREGYKPYGSRRCVDDPLSVKHHHQGHHHASETSAVSHHHHHHNVTTERSFDEPRVENIGANKLQAMSASSTLATNLSIVITTALVLLLRT
ncbi:unnamed protein product [Acanthoscelides obtectus]|uniref:Uncharacterized protein n=2 Tax=Acanthoscelides obtectus TaxID=200917 RepID=A0A9P0KAA6_ACAOB|nr:unnamed protein product [Acanthoscelides obtectus]CAK1676461.1 hypothetical protein AOBTE_LOCUS30771 [Acanthoscelides obtectus]